MRIVRGSADRTSELVKSIRESFDGRDFVYRPVYDAQLRLLAQNGPGEHLLVLEQGRIVAIIFVQRVGRLVTPLFLDQSVEGVCGALRACFGRSRRWVKTVVRPLWDLRVGSSLLPLLDEFGFRPGPPQRLYRLLRSGYWSGDHLCESIDGSRVDYRMHHDDIAGTLATLTPLLKSWSGFYGFEGHSEKTCRLFTASVDAQKAAMLWVLLPEQCRPDQNDCCLHWKEEIGAGGIYVRSMITEEPFRGRGIGSSLHRFMLSRFFGGSGAVAASWISTNEENRASVGLLESLGYRRQLVCRYHHFIR
jgi:GNAT superfamily N-acetyltransferase